MKNHVGQLSVPLALLAVCAMRVATPAGAQQVGTYSGMTADGHSFSFAVGKDPNNGDFELTTLTIQYTAQCPASGTQFSQGESFGFANGQDIVGGKITFLFSNVGFYTLNQFVFGGKNGATGNTQVRLPLIVAGDPPKKAELCVSAKQAFSATRQ